MYYGLRRSTDVGRSFPKVHTHTYIHSPQKHGDALHTHTHTSPVHEMGHTVIVVGTGDGYGTASRWMMDGDRESFFFFYCIAIKLCRSTSFRHRVIALMGKAVRVCVCTVHHWAIICPHPIDRLLKAKLTASCAARPQPPVFFIKTVVWCGAVRWLLRSIAKLTHLL